MTASGTASGPRIEFWDVFTTQRFGGNPLAVVYRAEALEASLMQRVAREIGFSETVFVLPPEAGGDARLRIFTPHRELPFAGHPTIGAAVALATAAQVEDGALPAPLVLEEKVGPIPCTFAQVDGHLRATLTTDVPLELGPEIPPADAAACLSLPGSAVVTAQHPPRIASKGVMFLFVELASPDLLERAAADLAAMRTTEATLPPPMRGIGYAPYVRRAPDALEMRMFEPLGGIPEDPATGSAAAALAALLCQGEARPIAAQITQGIAMGRPSHITVTADDLPGGGSRVTVGGSAVRVLQGTLDLWPPPAP